jgi:hypothetical protein
VAAVEVMELRMEEMVVERLVLTVKMNQVVLHLVVEEARK